MDDTGNDMLLLIFELVSIYPRYTEKPLRHKRIQRRKDNTLLVWHGTQSLKLYLGTIYLEHLLGREGDSSILNDIHEIYSRMLSSVWFSLTTKNK